MKCCDEIWRKIPNSKHMLFKEENFGEIKF